LSSYYDYVFSSTKSVTRAERNLPETKERMGEREGRGAWWRNDPKSVCSFE
jgi:hypothetical protein